MTAGKGRCADDAGPYRGCHWTCQVACAPSPPVTALPSADLRDAEALTLARIEAAPDAAESLRERVVTAMHQAVCDCGDSEHGIYFWAADMAEAADAAIDALRGPTDDAWIVAQLRALLREQDPDAVPIIARADLEAILDGDGTP